MTEKNDPPLRGDAAWQAEKKRIAASNDAAQARGREHRAQATERVMENRREAARRDAANLPVQPNHD